MKAKELRELDNAALEEKLAEFRKELFNLRFQHATAQLENTQRLSDVKKDIAKILTVQREKELGA
ncbi:50S ribosomal protein L29 [Maridesulfovibrio hydrothermalis]|uniref:Large ribosomal subunit protein uL29 n=1 Tax=Maridesulfovibrio hydrothermalis AM13 = DSM 14728 TaxID=1121451 RepID=L0RGB5_9BACT|nr:50S ribosomal protein L29 [Maridesulfovibrio hydrothermalis]CCO25255.1 ribosomal protein L29 [Maridesulfovibrio hydrothermalis AM13 = DSM 14728]